MDRVEEIEKRSAEMQKMGNHYMRCQDNECHICKEITEWVLRIS